MQTLEREATEFESWFCQPMNHVALSKSLHLSGLQSLHL